MYIYWITCLYSMLIALFVVRLGLSKDKKVLVSLITLLPLLILSSLRYGVGTDYANYTHIYLEEIPLGQDRDGRLEPAYYFLCRILYFLGAPNQVQFIVLSLITLWCIYLYIWKESPSPILSIFLFIGMTFYMGSLNTVRQYVAVAILLYGLTFFFNKDKFRFLFFALIAALFHKSALFFLVYVLLVDFICFSRRQLFVCLLLYIGMLPVLLEKLHMMFVGTDYEYFFMYSSSFTWQTFVGFFVILSLYGLASLFYCDSYAILTSIVFYTVYYLVKS